MIVIILQYSSDLGLWIKVMLKHQIFRGSLCPHIVQEKEQVKDTRGKEAGTWKGRWAKLCLAHSASSTATEQLFWQAIPVLCLKVCSVLTQEEHAHWERPGCPEMQLCRVGPSKSTLIQLPQKKPRSRSNENYRKGKTGWKSTFLWEIHPQNNSATSQLR